MFALGWFCLGCKAAAPMLGSAVAGAGSAALPVAGATPGASAGGAGVKVGVIDGGVDVNHPDLTGAIDLAKSCSFITTGTPTADPLEVANGDCSNKAAVQDLSGHGTHVATTIAARRNKIGLRVSPRRRRSSRSKACTQAASRTRSPRRCVMRATNGSTS